MILVKESINFINNLQQILQMIPVSNGKSPRVDQFYAALRYLKPHQVDAQPRLRNSEDRSIQYIRSLGKQILQRNPSSSNKKHHHTQTTDQYAEARQKADNLYDKYRAKHQKQHEGLINRRRQRIMRDQIKSKEKVAKNKKYQQVEAKVYEQTGVKNLNYKKRTDIKAQELKQTQKIADAQRRQVKQKQVYYQKKINSKPVERKNLFQRGIETNMRKIFSTEKRKEDLFEKQLEGATFFPERTSKDLMRSSSGFMDRLVTNKKVKLSKQKEILEQALSCHRFHPQINRYHQSPSVVKKIWERKGQQSEEFKNDEQQQPTMHSATHVTVKKIEELQFLQG